MMTKIEMDAMNAVIGIHREMKRMNEPDWERRRYEIARSVLPDFRDGSNVWLSAEEAAKCAVHYADALIAELKKGAEPCD
jgi:hypothetical protein